MTKLYKCLLISTVAMAMPALAGEVVSTAGTGPAAHQSGAAIAPEAAKRGPGKAKKDKLICKRRGDFDTGSHLRASKTCLKESEWKEREDSSERFLRSVFERSGVHDVESPGMPSPQ